MQDERYGDMRECTINSKTKMRNLCFICAAGEGTGGEAAAWPGQ